MKKSEKLNRIFEHIKATQPQEAKAQAEAMVEFHKNNILHELQGNFITPTYKNDLFCSVNPEEGTIKYFETEQQAIDYVLEIYYETKGEYDAKLAKYRKV